MRIAFIKALTHEAAKNPKLIVLTGDLGYSVFEEYKAHFPKQFINLGVGEANMMGMAAGLASEGHIPIVYSIIPFLTHRCYEQIRNDVCSHETNVKIVGVGSGLGYAHLGISHHSAEDISIMRTLPHLAVVVPADPYEVSAAVEWMFKERGPVYVRLGKAGEPIIHSEIPDFQRQKVFVIKRGDDGLIFCTGTIASHAFEAAKLLEAAGYNLSVISVPFIKPLPSEILRLVKRHQAIFSVEEHSVIGGLGSSLTELLSEHGVQIMFLKRIGIPDTFCRTIGSYNFMRDSLGLSPLKIAAVVKKTLNKFL